MDDTLTREAIAIVASIRTRCGQIEKARKQWDANTPYQIDAAVYNLRQVADSLERTLTKGK